MITKTKRNLFIHSILFVDSSKFIHPSIIKLLSIPPVYLSNQSLILQFID
jgi:hypothetical protein